jgi:hypothetical protein
LRIVFLIIGIGVFCYVLFELVNFYSISPSRINSPFPSAQSPPSDNKSDLSTNLSLIQDDRLEQVLNSERRTVHFAVLFLTNDTHSLSALEKGYVEAHERGFNGRNYVIQPIGIFMKSDWVFDHFAHYRKMLIGPSLDSLRKAVAVEKDHLVDVVAYDIEHWPRTPPEEKNDPVASIREGASIVHGYGYRYGITPDARYLLENYKTIEWKEIDFVALQFQRFSNNKEQFINYTRDVSSYIKSINPATEIFVQVSFRYTDANQMIQIIEDTPNRWVDGILIVYLPNSNDSSADVCSPRCNPEALESVLHRINTLNEMPLISDKKPTAAPAPSARGQ